MLVKLSVVEAVFEFTDGRVVLDPGIPPDASGTARVGDTIVLIRPDGTKITARVGGLVMLDPNWHGISPIVLQPGLIKADVPVGTEVWVEQQDVDPRT